MTDTDRDESGAVNEMRGWSDADLAELMDCHAYEEHGGCPHHEAAFKEAARRLRRGREGGGLDEAQYDIFIAKEYLDDLRSALRGYKDLEGEEVEHRVMHLHNELCASARRLRRGREVVGGLFDYLTVYTTPSGPDDERWVEGRVPGSVLASYRDALTAQGEPGPTDD